MPPPPLLRPVAAALLAAVLALPPVSLPNPALAQNVPNSVLAQNLPNSVLAQALPATPGAGARADVRAPLPPGPAPAAPPAAPAALDTPEAVNAAYDNAVNAFKYQDFDAAVPQLRALLYPVIRLDFRRELLVREYLASSLWWQGKREEAMDEFTALLVKNPRAKLDPAQYPPKMVAEVEARRKRLQETGVIRDLDATPPIEPGPALREAPPLPLAFLPFGAGQFANGQTGKGWAFLAAEAVLAGVSAGMYLANAEAGRSGPRPLRDDVIQISAGAGFWLLAGLGIWDALANRPVPKR